MEVLRLNDEEFENLKPIKFKNVIHTESDIYDMPGDSTKLLKIYDKLDEDYLYNKKHDIDNLIRFNSEVKIDELVVPIGYIYLYDLFIGEVLPKINGVCSTKYIYNEEISINKKIEILKKIGIILKKIHESKPEYNACFSDVHSDNFMVSNDNVYAVDTSSMKVFDSRGVTNYYLYQLSTMRLDKYEVDYAGMIKPNRNTDIYCYIMMILRFLSGSDLYIMGDDIYKDYLKKLLKNGFDKDLISSFMSVYEEEDNICPLPYLDSLKDLDEEKLKVARKIF